MNEVAAVDQYKSLRLRATAVLVLKKPPCLSWMLAVMSTLKPEHEIFGRNYQPPKLDYGGRVVAAPLIPDPHGFFSGIDIGTL